MSAQAAYDDALRLCIKLQKEADEKRRDYLEAASRLHRAEQTKHRAWLRLAKEPAEDEHLKEPVRKYEDTFSAVTVLKRMFGR